MLNYLSQQLIFGMILLLPIIHFLFVFWERINLRKIKHTIISKDKKQLIKKDILFNQILTMFIILFISLLALINLVVTTSPALQQKINGEVSQGIIEETYNNEFDFVDPEENSSELEETEESSVNNVEQAETDTFVDTSKNPKLNSTETNYLLVILLATSLLTCFFSITNISNIKHSFINQNDATDTEA